MNASAKASTEAESDDQGLPPYVTKQRDFYARTTSGARRGYQATEVVSITAAAAVPVAVATGSPHWLTAGLGALAAVATGLRQAFNYRENWVMRALAYEAIKGHIARYQCEDPSSADRKKLVDRVYRVSLAETARWQQVLSQQTRDAPPA